jgi:L-2,4-diaminobutyrate transaminase
VHAWSADPFQAEVVALEKVVDAMTRPLAAKAWLLHTVDERLLRHLAQLDHRLPPSAQTSGGQQRAGVQRFAYRSVDRNAHILVTLPKTDSSASELDRRRVFHPFTVLREHELSGGRMIVSGEGVHLRDDRGRTYIDAMAGLWCVNVGYGRRELADAVHAQALKLPYYHSFSSMATDPPARLAERLIELAPVPMSKVFFGNSGSDANDTQIKLVWFYNNALGRPLKKKIIARNRGYHGVTIAAASLTGLKGVHDGFDLPLSFAKHTKAPHRLWEATPGASDAEFVAALATDLEQLIIEEGPETVAAFIAEPIQAAGGVIVPPDGYFAAIQEVLARYDVLLIADEVVCGFGRLGRWFGGEILGLDPDLVTVAKGLTSAYVPLSACLVSEKIWRVIVDGAGESPFGHGYTYTSHPLAAAVAMANLDVIERDHLVEDAVPRGERLQTALHSAFDNHPLVGEVRGMGLIAAVEFVAQRDPPTAFEPSLGVGSRVARACLDRGLITRALPSSDTIAFSPPLVISDAEIDTAVAIARDAFDAVARDL